MHLLLCKVPKPFFDALHNPPVLCRNRLWFCTVFAIFFYKPCPRVTALWTVFPWQLHEIFGVCFSACCVPPRWKKRATPPQKRYYALPAIPDYSSLMIDYLNIL